MTNGSSIAIKLALLQDTFKKQLPDKIKAIVSLWQDICFDKFSDKSRDKSLSELHLCAHSLAGSSGTFGAVAIGVMARELERTLKSLLDEKNYGLAFSDEIQKIIVKQIDDLKTAVKQWQPNPVAYVAFGEANDERTGDLVYLVEDDELLAKDLIAQLEAAKYRVKHFSELKDFEAAFERKMPAAIIMDIIFSESNTAGADVIARVRDKYNSCSPVIFISVRDDMDIRLAAARAGAARYFCKPLDTQKFISTLSGLTEKIITKPYRVLLVDDDEILLDYYTTVLRDAKIEVMALQNPLDCLQAMTSFKPDIVVTDVYMPRCSGPELAQIIRQDDAWAMMPIMFLSTETSLNRQLMAMDLGSDDFLVKPIDGEHLVAAVLARVKRARRTNLLNKDLQDVVREGKYLLSTMDQHDIVSSTDIAGRILTANDKFCEVSGYSREELIGRNHRILNSGFHSKIFYEELWQTISSGKVWRGTICNVKKNGEEYWVKSTIVPFLDDKGMPYKYVSARTDITESRASRERLERGQLYAGIGTWDWDVRNNKIYWTDKVKAMYGLSTELERESYKHLVDVVHPDDKQIVGKAITACMEQGVKLDIEHRVIWPDGSVHWLLERGDVQRADNGDVLHMVGVVQDITKAVETRILHQQTEERFSFAVEGAGDGVWDWNIENNVFVASKQYMQMIGYDEGDLPNHIDSWINSVHPEDLERAQFKLEQYLIGKASEYAVELRLRCKDDSYKWILCRGTVVERDIKRQAIRMIGIHSDISRQKAVEQDLIVARADAEYANRAKSEFLSSMSHELRTPMNAIIGFSQLLQMDQDRPLDKHQSDNVEEIYKAGTYLLKLINEVLDLSKIEAGHIDLSIESVVLGEVINESFQLIVPLAKKRGIEISVSHNSTDIGFDELLNQKCAVRADRTRLKQALLNLLSNAVKYNNENGKLILAFDNVDGNYIRISVTDTGQGISEKQKNNLFEAFNRLSEESGDIEGTGIGLVITKNIVELMGGDIGVESKLGEGSTFWIQLPNDAWLDEKKYVVDDSVLSAALPFSNDEHEHTVLYIEDNPANLRLVTQLLGRLRHIHMWSAHEPMLGLDLAAEHKPDLILLDINLPGMSGYEVLKKLRSQKATCDTLIIAISANAMPRDIEKGMKAGFDDYITKPLDVNQLLQSVSFHLTKV